MNLSASVGKNGSNRPADVLEVQELLNRCSSSLSSFVPLREDGLIGDVTIQAIVRFQSEVVGDAAPDGRVDPDGTTYRALVARAGSDGSASSTFPLLPDGSLPLGALCAVMPTLSAAKADAYLAPLNAALKEAAIDSVLRVAAFLAQLGHESADLCFFQELADGSAYEGRADLGNTQPGDGPRFKGRGPIQLTGRTNYTKAGADLQVDLVNHPELAATPEVGFRVAGWFWSTRRLNAKADAGDFDGITRSINGGLNGKDDRDRRYLVAKRVLGLASS